jgi:hypothetical protein
MAIKTAGKYNEPLTAFKGDVVPRMRRLRARDFSSMVRTRLEVEQDLSRCGNDERSKTFVYTTARRRALLAILAENDSPLSASLRADAALVAGALADKKFITPLRKLALDEHEDLETRLNAIGSYLQLAGARAATDLEKLLASKSAIVRRTAYLGAFGSKAPQFVAVAEKRFQREKNARVRSVVSRKIPALQMNTTRAARNR